MKSITSKNNPTLKRALQLHESRGRRQQNRIIVFGNAEVSRAADAGIEFRELFYSDSSQAKHGDLANELARRSKGETFCLSDPLYQKLAFGDRVDGIVGVAKRPNTELENFGLQVDGLVVVLEAIEKPGNVGAVFRSATGAGVDAVILADPVTDCFHPNAIRASLGSVFSTPVFCAPSADVKQVLLEKEFRVIATRVDATETCFQCDLTGKTAIVLGNEANGLSDTWQDDAIRSVVVPMFGEIDSLNIAMTATLLAYESRRQRIS